MALWDECLPRGERKKPPTRRYQQWKLKKEIGQKGKGLKGKDVILGSGGKSSEGLGEIFSNTLRAAAAQRKKEKGSRGKGEKKRKE